MFSNTYRATLRFADTYPVIFASLVRGKYSGGWDEAID